MIPTATATCSSHSGTTLYDTYVARTWMCRYQNHFLFCFLFDIWPMTKLMQFYCSLCIPLKVIINVLAFNKSLQFHTEMLPKHLHCMSVMFHTTYKTSKMIDLFYWRIYSETPMYKICCRHLVAFCCILYQWKICCFHCVNIFKTHQLYRYEKNWGERYINTYTAVYRILWKSPLFQFLLSYTILRVNLDKIMHARWEFDASSARNRRVSTLDKHQNWSASALFCLNSRAQSKYAVVNLIHTQRKQTFLSFICDK